VYKAVTTGEYLVGPISAIPPGRWEHRREVPTSLTLVARLRDQDQDAWRDLLSLYSPLVVRWCERQGLSEHDTADVAQNVFRQVALHVDTFHKDAEHGSFRGWLCRITHREITNFFRGRGRLDVPQGGTDLVERLEQVPDRPLVEPGDDEVGRETRFLFQKAVQIARSEFSEQSWQIFWRVTVDGQPAPAVAAEFATTPAAVRQLKSRVLRRLKLMVGDLPEG
jgi:RNA polymerase sigma-70 factor (ECF subfamily)